jgi:F-type H+-transporting ATPase subunit epsilon
MTPFNLKIVTPSGVFFDGQTPNVIVRTTVGDKGILARHEPYVAALPIGTLRVMNSDASATSANKYRTAAISTGTIQVEDSGDTMILVQSCEWCDEIDVPRAEAAKARAEAEQERAKSNAAGAESDDERVNADVQYAIAEFKLKRALNRLNAVGK